MALSDRRKRERERRRALIIQSAAQEFASRGVEGASMDAIARRAELGKATLYYYFATKEALHAAVVESAGQAFFSGLLGAGERPASLEQATSDLLRTYVDFCRREPAWLGVIAPFLLHMSRSALGAQGQAGQPAMPSAHGAWSAHLDALLADSPWAGCREAFVAFLTDCFLVLGQRALAGQDAQLDARIDFYLRVVAQPPHLPKGPRS